MFKCKHRLNDISIYAKPLVTELSERRYRINTKLYCDKCKAEINMISSFLDNTLLTTEIVEEDKHV